MIPYEKPIKDPVIPNSYDPEVTNWLAWWLNNRRKQLRQNANNTYRQINLTLKGNDRNIKNSFISSLKNTNLGGIFSGISRDRLFTNRIYYAQLDNTSSAPRIIKDKNKVAESFVESGLYNIKKHTITYPGIPSMETRIHEGTHAMKASPLEDTIRKMKLEYYQNKYENDYMNYLLDPREIYARMNLFRYNTKVNPNKVIDKEFLNKHRYELSKFYLDIFTDNTLILLFNEVAQNNRQDDSMYYAKKGIKLITRKNKTHEL